VFAQQNFCSWYFFIFSQMVNWVGMNFGQQLNIIMMLLLEKFGKNPVHGSRENSKMVVDDGGSFLKNSEAF
jgi:hypothetical protein